MSLTEIERGDTYKITNIYYSGAVAAWPVSANVTLYDPNGTAIFTDKSGVRTGTTGEFYYHISTNSTHDLGIWIAKWTGGVNYGVAWGILPSTYRNVFQLVKVD